MDSLFAQQRITFLSANDFDLNTPLRLTLKNKGCYLVLFHNNEPDSVRLAQIWTSLATKVVGPVFASCDLMMQPPVVQGFIEVSSDSNNPLRWMNLKKVPLIVSYRGGFPTAAYNGVISEAALMNYASQLVCSADYQEPVIVPSTVQEHPHADESVYRA